MSNNITFRFAFGTADRPGSSVWRANIVRKKGDVYLHNAAGLGFDVHVALHASGKWSVKTGAMGRYQLAGPYRDAYGLFWGPLIYFYVWEREIDPPPPDGNIDQIQWLGWPDRHHYLIVKTQFGPSGMEVLPQDYERRIFPAVPAILNNEAMDFHLFLRHQPMTEAQKQRALHPVPEPLDYGNGTIPNHAELIRIKPGDTSRPVQIIHEPFRIVRAT